RMRTGLVRLVIQVSCLPPKLAAKTRPSKNSNRKTFWKLNESCDQQPDDDALVGRKWRPWAPHSGRHQRPMANASRACCRKDFL
uniref:Uncharacterized protein n=1 Tax=Oryzias latipes TaxID=8090 RepID=A0A3B3I8G7_ORYLA